MEKLFGTIIFLAGILFLVLHILNFAGVNVKNLFRKLEPMQKKFGKTAGTIIHIIFYVLLPIIVGILLIRNAG